MAIEFWHFFPKLLYEEDAEGHRNAAYCNIRTLPFTCCSWSVSQRGRRQLQLTVGTQTLVAAIPGSSLHHADTGADGDHCGSPSSPFYLKNFFWLCCVFVAARGLSLVAASGGYSSLWCMGFSLRWLLLLRSTGSRHTGFSSCGSRALERRLSSCGAWA